MELIIAQRQRLAQNLGHHQLLTEGIPRQRLTNPLPPRRQCRGNGGGRTSGFHSRHDRMSLHRLTHRRRCGVLLRLLPRRNLHHLRTRIDWNRIRCASIPKTRIDVTRILWSLLLLLLRGQNHRRRHRSIRQLHRRLRLLLIQLRRDLADHPEQGHHRKDDELERRVPFRGGKDGMHECSLWGVESRELRAKKRAEAFALNSQLSTLN